MWDAVMKTTPDTLPTMPTVLKNLVLYSPTQRGNRYRQIAIVKRDSVFEVRIFGGDIDLEDPDFIADNPDADVESMETWQ
jgi:hypothetical protein